MNILRKLQKMKQFKGKQHKGKKKDEQQKFT